MRWLGLLLGLLVLGCRERGLADPAGKCETLLLDICQREADCERASNPALDRATLVADCQAVFDCAKVRHMRGPYETCRKDIAAATCPFIKTHDRSLVAFILSAESPLATCNRVLMR
jgi:hypothetical protein